MKWPTLISFWSAATGLAIAVFPAQTLLRHGGFSQSYPERLFALGGVGCVLAFIVLSIFLYLGRLWAHRALATAVGCFVLLIVAFIALRDWRLAVHDISRVAVYIIVLGPPLFVLGVLFQPDVIRTFPSKRGSRVDTRSNT